jgi:hypothetical protein
MLRLVGDTGYGLLVFGEVTIKSAKLFSFQISVREGGRHTHTHTHTHTHRDSER